MPPSILVSDIIVYEPVTLLTDFLLTFFCVLFFNKVRKFDAMVWSLFFIFMAVSTFFGGIGHGFFSDKNNQWMLASRISGIITIYLISMTTISKLTHEGLRKFLNIIILIQGIIAIALLWISNDFFIVRINGTIGIGLLVTALQIYFYRRGERGAGFILAGILVNSLTWLVYSYDLSYGKWITQNDISHLIMVVGLYFFALGAIRYHDHAYAV